MKEKSNINNKTTKTTIIIGSLVAILLIFSIFIILLLNSKLSITKKYIYIAMFLFVMFSIYAFFIWVWIYIKEKREIINKTFDKYIEENISFNGVGILIFNNSYEIIWASKFIEQIFNKKVIGKKINSVSSTFEKNLEEGKELFEFKVQKHVFVANVKRHTNTIIIKNITDYNFLMNKYIEEKPVVFELEIDNFQQLQVILPEEELFKTRLTVVKILDELSEKYNLIYKQDTNGKYFVFTNQNILNKLINLKFNFLNKIRKTKHFNGEKLTISIGVGYNSSKIKDLIELAKDGLAQSLARGGDQVSIIAGDNTKDIFFGSKIENIGTLSKVKIKKITKLLEDKLNSTIIKKVLICGHKYADLDSIGASLGMYQLAKSFGKKAHIQNVTFDLTGEKSISNIEDPNIFITKKKAEKFKGKDDTLIIIVDTSELNRIENPQIIKSIEKSNIFIFDHHRVSKISNDIYVTNTYINPSASSASEIITEVMQFINKPIKITKYIAQMLLNGIFLDTRQFTKTTSSRTFSASSWLEKKGATSLEAYELLKLPQKYFAWINKMVYEAKEIKPGFFLSSSNKEIPKDIISLAADEILRINGRKASFVIAKLPKKNRIKMSARGYNVNVQIIAENVGGGGHFSAAAAETNESLEIFEDNLIQSIVSIKGE